MSTSPTPEPGELPFHHPLGGLLHFEIDEPALAKLPWRDFGNGVALAKLARQGPAGMVLYRIAADADPAAFTPHRHPGGEFYLVLKGAIADESGTYGPGEAIWMSPGSRHSPRGVGDTLILVLWPNGIES